MADSIRLRFSANVFSIDKDCTAVLDANDAIGWLLSTPSTATHSKMQLKKSRQNSSSPISRSDLSTRDRAFERREVACRQISRELHHRLTSSVPSIDSNPGMTYDPFASTNSDTSFEDLWSHNPSAVDVASEKLWREYPLEGVKGSLFDTPSYTDFSAGLRFYDDTDAQYSPRSRSPLSPETLHPYSSKLRQLDAVSVTRDRNGTAHAPKAQPLYHAFPPAVTNFQSDAFPLTSHQSLPPRKDSRIKQRPRAQTEPPQRGSHAPSSLNVCVPANNDIQYIPSTSPSDSHRSAPPTPLVLPDDSVIQYVSQFDDDDDDEDARSDFFGSISRLCRRGSSNASGSWGKKSTLEKQKQHPRKSLSEVLKSCFVKSK